MPDMIEVEPGYFVMAAEPSTGWHTVESARDAWDPSIDEGRYAHLLEISRDICEGYAPALAEGAPVPARYREAQVLYARETFNSARVSPSGDLGGDSYAFTPFPLSWKVKGLLRPQRRVPAIG